MKTDIVIVGTGVSGLYCALNLPRDKKIVMVTKADDDKSDSFLAQGGICVLKDENDYDSYFEDTMRAGHYENNKESVDIMIRSSRDVINDLVGYGVRFEKENGEFAYTKEGAHSTSRILFHEDITGKEITSHLLTAVKELDNAISGGKDGVATGIAQCGDDLVTILTDAIESKEEIDLRRAEEAKQRAEARLDDPNMDMRRAEVALKKAINRISVKNELK